MTAVTIERLSVRYDSTPVLSGVDVAIADGELFFLLGPSGCGKTTLLRTIAGFVAPAEGTIRFDDRDMTHVPPAKRDCGMVFQNYALWPHMTVAENVRFGLDVRKVASDEKARRVAAALALVRMTGFEDRSPGRLSGGQQQRVALARALVVEPAVLLLDEPLSNLDAQLRVELRAEIHDIQRKTRRTAVYVTHDRAEALALADRIAVLNQGKIEQIGAPTDLYDRPATPFVAGFVGDVNRLAGGAIVGRDAERVVVDGPFGRVVARPCGGVAQAAAGARALVMVRPERARIAESGAGLAGRVVRHTFLGEVVQHDVELSGGAVLRSLQLSGARAFATGSNVRIQIDDALAFAE